MYHLAEWSQCECFVCIFLGILKSEEVRNQSPILNWVIPDLFIIGRERKGEGKRGRDGGKTEEREGRKEGDGESLTN